ncbi:MAG: PorT family protein [Cyclobacteriaceae bacterium]|nr:PorT family protein [Cyclobacteriaceae bacterium]
MKLALVGSILLLFPFFSLYAQSPWSVGAKAGLSYSTLSVDDNGTDYSYAPGYHVGAFAQYRVAKISVQSEFIYSNLVAGVEAGGEDLNFNTKYISIPIVLQYEIVPSVQLAVGPQVGFLCCVKSEFHPVTREKFNEQDYTKAYKNTDFGFQAGAGWEAQNGLLVDLRYYFGLTDISNFEGVAPTKNRWLQLSVGYRLKFK